MYIAAPEYMWTIIAAILVVVFLLLIQKFILTGKTFQMRVAEKDLLVKTLTLLLKTVVNEPTNKKEEANADEEIDEDEDLDDIVDDFLK